MNKEKKKSLTILKKLEVFHYSQHLSLFPSRLFSV